MDIGLHSVKCSIAAALIDELVVCSILEVTGDFSGPV